MTTARPTVDIDRLHIESLNNPKALDGFSCGEREVDRHIQQCCDWHASYIRRVYCAFLPNTEKACGFYCISVQATETKYMDRSIAESAGSFNYVPFVYLNYIGVCSQIQNNGIGAILLMHAVERSSYVVKNIGVFGVALNALNDRAAGLYDRYGFRERGRRKYPFMILPAKSVLDLFP